MFVGDDRTDGPTAADHRLGGPPEVLAFLSAPPACLEPPLSARRGDVLGAARRSSGGPPAGAGHPGRQGEERAVRERSRIAHELEAARHPARVRDDHDGHAEQKSANVVNVPSRSLTPRN